MVITDVKVRRLTSAYPEPMQVYSDTCIVNATDIYPDFKRHLCYLQKMFSRPPIG